jgi:hypothetical protein
MIREALRRAVTRRDIAGKQFNETIFQFETDKQISPQEISSAFEAADDAVAQLQAAQQKYNDRITVKVNGRSMNLSYAVKRVGGAGRLEKMWRHAATTTGRDRYSYREMSRKADDILATRAVSVDEALQRANAASQFASELRAAIATANAKEVEMELSENLFK